MRAVPPLLNPQLPMGHRPLILGRGYLDDPVAAAFGRVLRRLRKENNLTQEGLAFDAELQRTFISLLELGRKRATLSTLFRLASALDKPASTIIAAVEEELHKRRQLQHPRRKR